MNCDHLFTEEMSLRYASLAVGSAKEEALREAVRDVSFLYELRNWFVRHGGGETSASAFTVRAISELIDQGWMKLGTWGENGTSLAVEASVDELMGIVGELAKTGPTYFLLPTQKGEEWVARYEALGGELHAG